MKGWPRSAPTPPGCLCPPGPLRKTAGTRSRRAAAGRCGRPAGRPRPETRRNAGRALARIPALAGGRRRGLPGGSGPWVRGRNSQRWRSRGSRGSADPASPPRRAESAIPCLGAPARPGGPVVRRGGGPDRCRQAGGDPEFSGALRPRGGDRLADGQNPESRQDDRQAL